MQPSNLIIPRSLRPGPPSLASVSGSYGDLDTSLPDNLGVGDSSSVVNGMERIDISEASDENVALSRSRTHRHHGALKAKSDAYVEYTNKTLAPEQTDFMIQSLQRKSDLRLKRTCMCFLMSCCLASHFVLSYNA